MATAHRLSLALLTLTAAATLSAPASAHFGQLTVNMKAGPYVPNIDAEQVNGAKVFPIYRCFFQGKNSFPPGGLLPLPELDVDMHVFDLFGSLELGMGVAATQAKGTSRPKTDDNATELAAGRCGEGGDNSVELSLLFIKPRLTYRFDALYDYLGIPLVPYARGALVGVGYFFTRNGAWDQQPFTDDDQVNTRGNLNPLGARLGYEVAGGMMFGLDWIDLPRAWNFWNQIPRLLRTGEVVTPPPSAKSTMVQHSYFFVEGVYSEIDSFGQPGLILSPTMNLFGTSLPLMWNAGFAVELF